MDADDDNTEDPDVDSSSSPCAPGIDERQDELTRRRSIIVGSRQGRPNLPSSGCPFCPGGIEAPEHYDVRWFPNRWPAMPDDRCEVVLYSPDHDAEFWSIGAVGARKVVDLWAARTEHLGARGDVDYVLIFENRGPQVGATIAHPHGQIYAYPDVPPEPLRELVDGVVEVPSDGSPLVVSAAGDWTAWVPNAAVWPYELRLAPHLDVGFLHEPHCDREGLAVLLIDVLARLDQLFDAPMPYMLWIHQRPTDGNSWPETRVHIHLTPLLRSSGVQRYVAAAELGAGIMFNPIEPRIAAAQLRDLPGKS